MASRLFALALLAASAVNAAQAGGDVFTQSRRQAKWGPSSLGPADDPFYRGPTGWKEQKPGAILRWREINVNNGAVANEYQLLFRSSSQNNTPIAAITTVFVPPGANKAQLVATARFDNTLNVKCAPSWGFTNGSVIDGNFLGQKYIVTSPDHLGPNQAMGAYILSGRIQLDAARATLAFKPIGWSKNAKVVLHGYSGGAGTCGWAASQAHVYAPELNVVGAAFGGTPADVYTLGKLLDGGLFAGLGFSAAFGLSHAYKAVDTEFDKVLTPLAKEGKAAAEQGCLVESFTRFIGQKLLSTQYNTVGDQLFDQKAIKPILDSLTLGSNKNLLPKMPVFMFHGMVDQIIPIKAVDPIADSLGKQGVDMVYLRTALAEHFADYLNVNLLRFLDHRFNDQPFPKGYRKINNGSPLDQIDFTTATSNVETSTMKTIQANAQAKNEQEAKRILSLPSWWQKSEVEKILNFKLW